MGTGEINAGCNPAMDYHPIQGEVEILLVASCYRNRDKFRPDGPLGSYADFAIGPATVPNDPSPPGFKGKSPGNEVAPATARIIPRPH